MQKSLQVIFLFVLFTERVFAGANSLPYMDEDFSCTSEVQAEKYVRDFGIDVVSFGGLELCDSKVDTKKLLNDLSLVESGRFNDTLDNVFIRGFVPSQNYYSWMKLQTRGMNRRNDIPYATAYNRGGYFTMQDGWAQSSTLGRVGVVIHEARHTAGYRHIPCTQGSYEGSSIDACDSTYAYGGSHAVEMEYYARVSVQGENFHPVYKTMARLMAVARSNFLFNSSPIQKREALLARPMGRQEVHLFEHLDSEPISREVPPQSVGLLKRASFGAVLFDGFRALCIELYENSGFNPVIEDAYSYFKLLIPRQELKDFEEFDLGSQRFLVRLRQDHKIQSYVFPEGDWGPEVDYDSTLKFTSTLLDGGVQGYFLVSEENKIYEFNPKNLSLNLLPKLWKSDVLDMASLEGQVLVLRTDGKIYRSTPQGNILWRESEHYQDLVSVPLYSGFEVVP